MMRGSIASGLRLGLVTAGVVAAVSATALLTAGRIAEQERRAEIRALAAVLPAEDFETLAPHRSRHADRLLGRDGPHPVVRGTADGRLVGLAVRATAPDGYNGDIELLVGISPEGTLHGVRVVSHRETPGLGDGIDREVSDWVEQFAGRSLGRPPAERWTVRRDGGSFDQFTGATITPRAVIHAVRRVLEWYRDEGADLLATGAPAARAASQAPR